MIYISSLLFLFVVGYFTMVGVETIVNEWRKR